MWSFESHTTLTKTGVASFADSITYIVAPCSHEVMEIFNAVYIVASMTNS